MTKMRLGKKEKTEGETECFLVSSGGLAFVWNENSECLRDYSGLAGPWEPSSYLYTSNMEYGNHRSVCVHAEKCTCLLLWADEWQFKQTHNVVNQKIKKQIKNKKAFSVWPHLLLHLCASMRWWNSTEPYFYFIRFSHWVTAFASLPPSSIHSPLRSFIPAGGAEKTLPCSIGFERR